MGRASGTYEINKSYNIHFIWVLEDEKEDWDKNNTHWNMAENFSLTKDLYINPWNQDTSESQRG